MRKKLRFGFSQKLPPTACPDCRRKLSEPCYDEHRGWSICCTDGCGCFLEWTWPGQWERRHRLPLFDQQRTDGRTWRWKGI